MVWWLLLGAGLSSVLMIIVTIYLGIFADRRDSNNTRLCSNKKQIENTFLRRFGRKLMVTI